MPTPKRPQNRQPPWQDQEDGPASFGLWLKQQRELRGVALRDISDETKISLRYLEALESNRFDVLPAQVFVRGFLRQYARFVGLDADEAVNAFLTASRAEVVDSDESGETEEPKSTQRGMGGRGWLLGLIVASVAAVMVLAALAAFSWRQSREGSGESAAPATPRSAASRPLKAGSTGEEERRSQAPGLGAEPAPSPTPGPSAATHASLGDENPEPRDRPPAATVAPKRLAEAATGQSAAQSPIVVTLDFAAGCWVDAVSDDS
ncbi:MAG TPA: helix-turn-helix domain-containing protein, partial [Thermoanaerobaculia bacterium]|nr:helix-turn-helix domain-containing protein [Thermoanaerobaculia bacterium]